MESFRGYRSDSLSRSSLTVPSIYCDVIQNDEKDQAINETVHCIRFAIQSFLRMMSKSDMPSLLRKTMSDMPLSMKEFTFDVSYSMKGQDHCIFVELVHESTAMKSVQGRRKVFNLPWFKDFFAQLMRISRSYVEHHQILPTVEIVVTLDGYELEREMIA